jgi:hypothetical protein
MLKKFEDENGREYPLTGGKTEYNARIFFDDDSDELNEEEKRLIMEDQEEPLIDKDEFN